MRNLVLVFLAACAHAAPAPTTTSPMTATKCTIITTEAELHACIGQTVTLRGTVANSKIPTLVGVDVDAEGLRGKRAEATGVLQQYIEPPAGLDEPIAAGRGAGTYYRLLANGTLAVATGAAE